MPTIIEELVESIHRCDYAKLNDREIARLMFVLDPCFIFRDNRIVGFRILNSIASWFRLPLGSVKIAGSAQTGFSPIKKREFKFGESDLDIAIVSPILYQKYWEIVYESTNGYVDKTRFKVGDDFDQFIGNLQNGFFRPDLMPSCKEKTDWSNFFKGISNQHSTIFKNINAGIYFSERFFEFKQMSALALLRKQ